MTNKILFILTIILVLSTLNITIPASSSTIKTTSTGTTLYVGGSGPNNYTGYHAIQDAINDANPGDRVFVYSGEYRFYLNLNKPITLQGENKHTTSLYKITIKSDNATITGFTFNGKDPDYDETGVLIKANNIVFHDNIVKNWTCDHAANYAKAIVITEAHSNITITNNLIENNTAAGVQLLKNSHNNTISNNQIIDTYKYGISISSSNKNHIFGNLIKYTRHGYGIAIFGSSKNNIIEENIIQDHEVGLYVDTGKGTNTFTKNLIRYNEVGIEVYDSYENFYIYNDFIANDKDTKITKYGVDDLILSLFFQETNTWKHNYWNESKIFPYLIKGKIYLPQMLGIKFFVAIDWRPAIKPNF